MGPLRGLKMIKLLAFLQISVFYGIFPAFAEESFYRIKPGDSVELRVLGHSEVSIPRITVDSHGKILIPLAGPTKISNLTVNEAGDAIKNILEKDYIRDPHVIVNLISRAVKEQISVYLVGEILLTGKKKMDIGTTLLGAIAEAGGLTKAADRDSIRIRRGDKIIEYFDYDDLLKGAGKKSST